MNAGLAIGGGHAEIVILASNRLHPGVLANMQLIVIGDLAIVLECLLARRLHVGGGERDFTDFQQLRRGEESHVGGIVENGVDQAPLVYNDHLESDLLRVNGAS